MRRLGRGIRESGIRRNVLAP